jgi:hypothetical protein
MSKHVQVQKLDGTWVYLGEIADVKIVEVEDNYSVKDNKNGTFTVNRVVNDYATNLLYKDNYKGSFEAEYNAEFMKNVISNTPPAVPYKESYMSNITIEAIQKAYESIQKSNLYALKPDDFELIKDSFVVLDKYRNNPEAIREDVIITALSTVVLSQYDIQDEIIQDRDW